MSMKTEDIEQLAPGIFLYKNLFHINFLETLLLSIENECSDPNGVLYWENSGVGESGAATEYRSSMTCGMAPVMMPGGGHPLHEAFKEAIHKPILECAFDYANIHDINVGVHEPYSLLKYSAGAHYRSHYDAGPDMPRTFSAVAYLKNTSTGGDLEFQHFKLRVPCIENSLLLFPASHPYMHYAHPVIDGMKYSLVTWYP